MGNHERHEKIEGKMMMKIKSLIKIKTDIYGVNLQSA
jgi:hypothetical protein